MTHRHHSRVVALLAMAAVTLTIAAKGTPKTGVTEIRLQGYVGHRIDQCIEKRIMGQNADELVLPFRTQKETRGRWASEFWGKWVQGAMSSYRYNHDPELLAKIRDAEEKLMACQLENGFIGDYTPETETTGWDIWGRKYTLLGLLKWYRLSGDKAALKAACRLLDYTMTQVGPAPKKAIYECGFYKGMPPMSILEPVMFMYGETKNPAYLDFARYIAQACESVVALVKSRLPKYMGLDPLRDIQVMAPMKGKWPKLVRRLTPPSPSAEPSASDSAAASPSVDSFSTLVGTTPAVVTIGVWPSWER